MKVGRKIQLFFLFSLSLGVVGVTLYRIPHVIWDNGRQQTRSLLASVELLFATTAANALVLGSFVRDRGVKKAKFHRNSATETFDSASKGPAVLMNRQWGSDEDLFRDTGMNLEPELRGHRPISASAGNYKVASPALAIDRKGSTYSPPRSSDSIDFSEADLSAGSGPRRSEFFDVGGLLEEDIGVNSIDFGAEGSTQSTLVPSPTHNASSRGFRRGSQAILQDLGGFLSSTTPRINLSPPSRKGSDLEMTSRSGSEKEEKILSKEPDDMVFMDPGGLLK